MNRRATARISATRTTTCPTIPSYIAISADHRVDSILPVGGGSCQQIEQLRIFPRRSESAGLRTVTTVAGNAARGCPAGGTTPRLLSSGVGGRWPACLGALG